MERSIYCQNVIFLSVKILYQIKVGGIHRATAAEEIRLKNICQIYYTKFAWKVEVMVVTN